MHAVLLCFSVEALYLHLILYFYDGIFGHHYRLRHSFVTSELFASHTLSNDFVTNCTCISSFESFLNSENHISSYTVFLTDPQKCLSIHVGDKLISTQVAPFRQTKLRRPIAVSKVNVKTRYIL